MIDPARVLWKMSRSGGIALLALSCCACAGPNSMSRLMSPKSSGNTAKSSAVQALYQETVFRSQSDSLDEQPTQSPAAGVVRLQKRPASATGKPDSNRSPQPTARGGVLQVSHVQAGDLRSDVSAGSGDPRRTAAGGLRQTAAGDPCPPFTINQCPPQPRWSAPSPNPFAQGMLGCPCETTVLAEKFPDEYLCDGGDRALPIHYDGQTRNGLDTEDTVAEFTDHTGKNRVRPTNRVCVYAPRMSTVRTISRPHEGTTLDEIAGVGHSVGTDQMHTRLMAKHHVKNEMSSRVMVRSRASGLESEQFQGNFSQVKRLVVHEKLLNVYQDLAFVQFGKIETKDAARLNFGIQASLIWTREESPIIAAKTETAMTGTYEAHAATIVGIDDKKSDQPGDLRLVKLADKQAGKPGEEIEFTIRYDNMGPNTVHHVRIVDNLTPRLAYVEDSATSDRDGRLVVQDNGEGSLVLTWELTNPLPPKTGGVVSFKARIR